KFLIEMFQSCGKLLPNSEVGSRVGVARRRQQRGAYAVAGDVGEADHHSSVGEGLPVEVISAGVIGGVIPTCNVEPGNLGWLLGQKGLLGGTPDLEVGLHCVQRAV